MKIFFRFLLAIVFLFCLVPLQGDPGQETPRSQFFILGSPRYNPGMFSLFNTVLGFLEFYEQRQENAGILVDFGKKGHYYDKEQGENWWEYYFEPIVLGTIRKGAEIIRITEEEKISFSLRALTVMSRQAANQLIQKYIKVKPHIQKKIDLFVDQNFNEHYIIGVHYRGTDKITEAPRVPFASVYEEIEKAIKEFSGDNYKIFVATDEQGFLDDITKRYGKRVVFIDALRSKNNEAVHHSHRKKGNYKKGEDAVLDAILLSKCNLLIRTASNLSACSTYFNPHLRTIVLNQHYMGY